MEILEALLAQVAEITLPLSLVIAALLLLRPLLGRRYRAKAYYWAWLLVALRLAIPLNPTLPQAPVQVPVAEITVLSADGEDPAYYDQALAVLDEIVSAQSTEVDTVSGATFSSTGLIDAAVDALGKAAAG